MKRSPILPAAVCFLLGCCVARPGLVEAGVGQIEQAIEDAFGAPIRVTSTPTDGQVLTYDATTRAWAPAAATAGAFDDLTDVDLTGAANNDLLFRSGGNWIDTAGALTFDGTHLGVTEGTVAAPGIALAQDPDTGIVLTDDRVQIVAGASQVVLDATGDSSPTVLLGRNSTEGVAFTNSASDTKGLVVQDANGVHSDLVCDDVCPSGQVIALDGTAAAPSVKVGDEQNGFYSPGVNQLGVAIGGVAELILTADAFSTLGGSELSGWRRSLVQPSTSPFAVVFTTHGNNIFDDSNIAGTLTLNLPDLSGLSNQRGAWFTFTVHDTGLIVDPAADDKIVWTQSAGLVDGEYITSTTVGSSVTLYCNTAGDWVVMAQTGTWAEETP